MPQINSNQPIRPFLNRSSREIQDPELKKQQDQQHIIDSAHEFAGIVWGVFFKQMADQTENDPLLGGGPGDHMMRELLFENIGMQMGKQAKDPLSMQITDYFLKKQEMVETMQADVQSFKKLQTQQIPTAMPGLELSI